MCVCVRVYLFLCFCCKGNPKLGDLEKMAAILVGFVWYMPKIITKSGFKYSVWNLCMSKIGGNDPMLKDISSVLKWNLDELWLPTNRQDWWNTIHFVSLDFFLIEILSAFVFVFSLGSMVYDIWYMYYAVYFLTVKLFFISKGNTIPQLIYIQWSHISYL